MNDNANTGQHATNPAPATSLEGMDGLVQPPFSRRGFVMTGLVTGLTLATTRVEAQAISTDSAGLDAGDIKIPVADGLMPAYRASPAGAGPFPVVLVIEEIFGVHEYIKDICRRLAKLGYLAIAPELYARLADLTKVTDVGQIMREVISKLPDAQVASDLDATVAYAATAKGDVKRLGMTGFCRGGRTVLLYCAHNPAMKAGVAWYGPLGGTTTPIQPKNASDIGSDLKCPVLGLYGGADKGIPVADVEKLRDSAKAAGKVFEPVIYPEAGHAFHADYRPSYVKAAADDGWVRMQAWFKKYGVA